MAAINSNEIKLSDYKGRIGPCPHCNPERTLLGQACKECLGMGFLSDCLNCNRTGKVTAKAVWDGRSDYESVCNPCGGKGHFPARLSEYNRQQSVLRAAGVEPVAQSDPAPSAFRTPPPVVAQMTRLHIHRTGSRPVAAVEAGAEAAAE